MTASIFATLGHRLGVLAWWIEIWLHPNAAWSCNLVVGLELMLLLRLHCSPLSFTFHLHYSGSCVSVNPTWRLKGAQMATSGSPAGPFKIWIEPCCRQNLVYMIHTSHAAGMDGRSVALHCPFCLAWKETYQPPAIHHQGQIQRRWKRSFSQLLSHKSSMSRDKK